MGEIRAPLWTVPSAVPAAGRIPGVRVRVREVETNQAREVSTAADGAFRISELLPGRYEVSASQPGFVPYFHAPFCFSPSIYFALL